MAHAVPGIGRRFAILAMHRANIDTKKRAGLMTVEEQETLEKVFNNPRSYGASFGCGGAEGRGERMGCIDGRNGRAYTVCGGSL